MKEFTELLGAHSPQIAFLVTNIVFIIFLILNTADDFDQIKDFCKRLFDVGKHIDKLYYTRIRKKYDEILSSGDFITWQLMDWLLIKMDYRKSWLMNLTDSAHI